MASSDIPVRTPVVKCLKCGLPFALTFPLAPMQAVENLPDPFEAECSFCKHRTSYPKSSILAAAPTPRQ